MWSHAAVTTTRYFRCRGCVISVGTANSCGRRIGVRGTRQGARFSFPKVAAVVCSTVVQAHQPYSFLAVQFLNRMVSSQRVERGLL